MRLPPLLRLLLWPAAVFFEGLVLLRARLYAEDVCRQRRLVGRVISVGNLTLGGTGKIDRAALKTRARDAAQ